MRVLTFVSLFLIIVTGLTVYNHQLVHDSFNGVYLAVIFFLVLNILICAWELCLFAQIDYITETNKRFHQEFPNNKSQPVLNFLLHKMTLKDFFSGRFWSQVWSTYALFDGSYADRRTFGFNVDIGNGMSTLIPSLLLHIGYTYHFLPANIIGIISIMFFYQVTYNTSLYWVSFLVNKRHKLISFNENMIYIVGTNAPWVFFGIIGLYTSIRLTLDNNYSVFGI